MSLSVDVCNVFSDYHNQKNRHNNGIDTMNNQYLIDNHPNQTRCPYQTSNSVGKRSQADLTLVTSSFFKNNQGVDHRWNHENA